MHILCFLGRHLQLHWEKKKTCKSVNLPKKENYLRSKTALKINLSKIKFLNIEFITQTFKEYKFPIMSFIGSVYVLWKPHPEEGDRHWVIIQNSVPSNPPEPATLKR